MDDFSLPQQRPRAMTDVVSQRPLQLVKTSSDSRLKKAGILQALDQRQHQDMLSCSVGSSKNFSTMIRTRPVSWRKVSSVLSNVFVDAKNELPVTSAIARI